MTRDRALIQMKVSDGVKKFLINKSKECGFSNLTEYMLFVGINFETKIVTKNMRLDNKRLMGVLSIDSSNTTIQLKTNIKIKRDLEEKAEIYLFSSLTEYMMFTSLNSEIKVSLKLEEK